MFWHSQHFHLLGFLPTLHNAVHPHTVWILSLLNTLRPRQNGRHFADDVFKCIFLNANVWILLKISLKFVPKGQINDTPSLVQIMAWRRPGDKPLSEPMMVSLLMHIWVARPQWVNSFYAEFILEDITIYWHFLLSLNIELMQVVEILPDGRQGLIHPINSILWLLMAWWWKELGHQQTRYWPWYPRIFWFQYQKG